MLAVELCSLTLQREDLSIPNIIASGLFGDGAAAAVLDGGARGRGPRIAATRSVFYPGSERVMGWDVVDSGFKVVLSPAVPQLVREKLRADVDAFLSAQGLKRSEIAHFICHTGGPKVLEACEEALEIPRSTMQRSWDSLQKVGNLSSASVLFVLSDLLAAGEASPGDRRCCVSLTLRSRSLRVTSPQNVSHNRHSSRTSSVSGRLAFTSRSNRSQALWAGLARALRLARRRCAGGRSRRSDGAGTCA